MMKFNGLIAPGGDSTPEEYAAYQNALLQKQINDAVAAQLKAQSTQQNSKAPTAAAPSLISMINPAYTQAQTLDALAPMRAYQAYKRGLGETPGVSGATPGAPWNMNLLQSGYDLAAASGRTSAPRPGSGNTMPIGGK